MTGQRPARPVPISPVVLKLQAIRIRKGLSVRGAAKLSELSHVQIHNWENGTFAPTLAGIEKYARGLGCGIGLVALKPEAVVSA